MYLFDDRLTKWKCLSQSGKVIERLDETPHLVTSFLVMLTGYPIRFHGDESVINAVCLPDSSVHLFILLSFNMYKHSSLSTFL